MDPVTPGKYVEEIARGPAPIALVETAATAFVDVFTRGPTSRAVRVDSWLSFEQQFGGLDARSEASYAVRQFFGNGGRIAWIVRVPSDRPRHVWHRDRAAALTTALSRLGRDTAQTIGLLCVPAAAMLDQAGHTTVVRAATACARAHRAMVLVDPRTDETVGSVAGWLLRYEPLRSADAVLYLPRVIVRDPLDGDRPRACGASGTMAGLYARTDLQRGVWRAPAGTDATLRGVDGLAEDVPDGVNSTLNAAGVNALRRFPTHGLVAWGARTLDGSDARGSDYKYIPVRRTALAIEASLVRGLAWTLFEENDEPLWARIRLAVGDFMHTLFRGGAFQGAAPHDAYFVKCDRSTTTDADIARGVVTLLVGFAILRPAEFVVLSLQLRTSAAG